MPARVTGEAPASAEFQSYGVVVVADRALRIQHVSRNCAALLGREAEAVVGRPLSEILDDVDDARRLATQAFANGSVTRSVVSVGGGPVKVRAFDPGSGLIGLDLLPPTEMPRIGHEAQTIEQMASWNEQVVGARSVDELLDVATRVTGQRSGFDGTWIVRMEGDDGTGLIVTAQVPDATPAALGSHVQPSDLPPFVPYAGGKPVPYFVADLSAPSTELVPPPTADLRLSGSALALPFPDWMRWVATVGPRATVGIPIVVAGRLWGWILAHQPSAVRLSAAVQAELRLLGTATGARLAELLAADEARERLALADASRDVLAAVATGGDLVAGLAGLGSALAAVCDAERAVVEISGRRAVVGGHLAPGVVEQVLAVARRELLAPDAEAVVASPTLDGVVADDPAQAAGFAAVRLDPAAEHVIVWVRGEHRRTVRWAAHEVVGDTPQDELFVGLGERVELQHGACRPWTGAQLRQVAGIREALAEVFVARYGALQRFTAELARSNAEYGEFAHAAAHDLKSPLRGIRQSVEFYLEDAADPETQPDEALLLTAVRLAERMGGMLDDLMRYAQAGQTERSPGPIDLGVAVDEVVELLGSRADGASITVQPGPYTADPVVLRQVLLNLIANAVKYSEGDAEITVGVTSLAEVATAGAAPILPDAGPRTEVLTVADRGIGIAPVHHERIFGLFRQLDPTAEGSGAGLALCRSICRRHGGDIWLSSEPGQGTTFYVAIGSPSAPMPGML